MVPQYNIKYKDESLLMKLLGKILFFNKDFMTDYTTTIGSTIYFPSRQWVKIRQFSTKVVVLHEIIHMLDAQKYSQLLFSILYLFPQCLALLIIPFIFLFSWFGLFVLLFLAPIPAYFRMIFERRAYTFSLYSLHRFNVTQGFNIRLEVHARRYADNFTDSYYYFMWPFSKKGMEQYFLDAVDKIKNGERPYYDKKYYDLIDDMIARDFKV